MKYALTLTTIAALACVGCAKHEQGGHRATMPETRDEPLLAERIADWPETSRKAAHEMIAKYGEPAEVTDTQLIWHEHGPWKRGVVSREEVQHAWPSPHADVLEQTIDFQVEPDRFDDLARFDGSVMVERTKGELSARCGGEAANFLAINLARDVATGRRTVEEARAFYEQTVAQAADGAEKPEYMRALLFAEAETSTTDPDRPAGATSVSPKITAQQERRAPAAEQSSKRAGSEGMPTP